MTSPPDAKDLPAPLVPQEADLRDFRFMPLDLQKLFNSDTWRKAKRIPFACGALINLWGNAWHQVPAGSLPSDEDDLRDLAGVSDWESVKAIALRGFVKCRDGRLYHPVICGEAKKAWKDRQKFRKAANARWKKKSSGSAAKSPAASASPAPRTSGAVASHPASQAAPDIQETGTGKGTEKGKGTETGRIEKGGKEISNLPAASSGTNGNGFLKRMNGGADYSDPAKRKARWEQKIAPELHRRLPGPAAEAIIRAYHFGTPEERKNAKNAFEMVDTELKARKINAQKTGARKSNGAAA